MSCVFDKKGIAAGPLFSLETELNIHGKKETMTDSKK